ncbi:MAG: zincin-like metallopeptidase domain-containing protein [Eubacterium ventriosum]
MDRFETEYDYMAILFHEAGHATGHESRFNRQIANMFGSPEYAKEELRAEISSAFTAQAVGITYEQNSHMENHKAYIQSWISALKTIQMNFSLQ